MTAVAAVSDAFLPQAADGLLGEVMNEPTIKAFNKLIQEKHDELIENGLPVMNCTPSYCGAVILQDIIVRKINNFDYESFGISEEDIQTRLSYFNSISFIEHFKEKINYRTHKNQTIADSSYTDWFNKLFNVSYNDWREDKLSKVSNQDQCRRALNIPPSTKISDLQIGNIKCYLCGRFILAPPPQAVMECEHILPIITSLSHWWLVKSTVDKYSTEELSNLKYEYKWAHRCCNQLKSNYDFIYFDNGCGGFKKKFIYRVNEKMIKGIVDEIRENKKLYDCDKIEGKIPDNQEISIAKDIQPIVDEINKNVSKCTDYDTYILLTKYKVLSALTDESLLEAILGDGKLIEIPKSKAQIKRERKEQFRLLELEELHKYRETLRTQEENRAKRIENRRNFNITGIRERRDNETKKDYIKSILDEKKVKISPVFKVPVLLLELLGLTVDSVHINPELFTETMNNYIFENDKYNPSIDEINSTFEHLFLEKRHIFYTEVKDTHGELVDRTHIFFTDVDTSIDSVKAKNTGMGIIIKMGPIRHGALDQGAAAAGPVTPSVYTRNTGVFPKDTILIDGNKSIEVEVNEQDNMYLLQDEPEPITKKVPYIPYTEEPSEFTDSDFEFELSPDELQELQAAAKPFFAMTPGAATTDTNKKKYGTRKSSRRHKKVKKTKKYTTSIHYKKRKSQ